MVQQTGASGYSCDWSSQYRSMIDKDTKTREIAITIILEFSQNGQEISRADISSNQIATTSFLSTWRVQYDRIHSGESSYILILIVKRSRFSKEYVIDKRTKFHECFNEFKSWLERTTSVSINRISLNGNEVHTVGSVSS